jgi:TolB-like protein
MLHIGNATAGAFAGSTPPDAADALGVRYVLCGNLRSVGRQVRLALELYDHRQGGVIWSHSYDGSLDEGFTFQDTMTKRS